ncbi:conserved unknown protein [Ectocarpus siliculosus]|uniref:U3 small nucleolar RNA-associated protein 6 N-terminal domain-containing protein n=1 Tax=Ectocarpus siliculosus TaxID=2880 RepID=D8LSS2_ECTSI|nr:conserved unknown protein [Ectocarpus siliculosus]|eukprot:CBN75272.1 conserved unknown protein [Ectocarpus siliculosus]
MADSVQYALDRMVVDLEDLRCRGIFSEAEVRAIVSRRKGFEYMLRRHEARRLDFMRYVEYELNLESLRALRTRRIEGGASGGQQRNKKKTKKGKAATADFCCVRLVRWIFDRAVMKFPGDVDIWLHYIDFAARQGQSKALGRLFARALQLHPRNPGLWIKAASWEFFNGGNASSARSLMQRGLRINPGARNLWLQYFRLEFSYVEKLMGRREILGLEAERGGAGDNAQGSDDNDDDGGRRGMDIPELEAEAGQSGGPSFKAVRKAAGAEGALGGGDGARPAPVMNDTARRFYKGAVPMAVFRAAVKAIPADVGFRAGFLRCCAEDFPVLSAEVAQSILTSIERDFPESCEAWEVRASYPQLAAEAAAAAGRDGGRLGFAVVQESVDTFEVAVEAVGASQPDMWVRYASFLRGRLEACEGAEGRKRGGGAVDGGKDGEMVGVSAPAAAAAAALAARLREVLARSVEIHLAGRAAPNDPPRSSTTAVTAAIAARKERGGASLLATREVAAPAEELEAPSRRREEDSREALSAGLADVCLALGEPEEALAALRAATGVLPRRPGPWLRRAALERRLAALGGDPGQAGRPASSGKKPSLGGNSSSAGAAGADVAAATLRAGIKAVPPAAPGYPDLWRELLASLVASGGGHSKKGKTAVAAAFREAVEACGGGSAGNNAQGEFLAGYVRWSAAVEGPDAARRALQWARRSFLLTGTGAAAAYGETIELERALGEEAGEEGARAKRVRELFEDSVDKFGRELPAIWEEYAQFEIQEGDVKRANAVRWRSQQQQQTEGGLGGGVTSSTGRKKQRWG